MRVACYARYSSEHQRDTSLDDQIMIAREYANRLGWSFLEAQIYADAAISGSSMDRPGVQALLAAAAQRPRPFDVLLVDDTSRVSRDLPDAVRLLQQLTYLGVRVIYISQNIDSSSDQAETLIAVHGVVDRLYVREMAKKIKRGLAGQNERGYSTGGKTYGYRTAPVPDPSGKIDADGNPVLLGKRVYVVPDEATVIRDIFNWYSDGLGVGRIVARLNDSGVVAPRGGTWKDGAVKRLLVNEKFLGKLIWGQRQFVRRPGTSEKVAQPRPRDEWRVKDDPALRIISDALWQRVQSRRAVVREALPPEGPRRGLMRGKNAALYSPYLLSGFARCGDCGGAVVTVTGGKGSPRYGCQNSWRNGVRACANRVTIRAKVADRAILGSLQLELRSPATLRLVIAELTTALNERANQAPRLLAEARAGRQHSAQRLDHLVRAIESGVASSAVASAIASREAEVLKFDADIEHLLQPPDRPVAVIPAWVAGQLADTAALLATTPERTKVEFRRLGLKVLMHVNRAVPTRPHYRAEVSSALPCLVSVVELARSTADRSLPRSGP